MSDLRWEVYPDAAGEHRWRAVARNGRIVADGAEGYASERNARRALASFQAAVKDNRTAAVIDLVRRCSCKKPAMSQTVTNLCTACGLLR